MKVELFTAGFVLGFACFPAVSLLRAGRAVEAALIAGAACLVVAWMMWPEDPTDKPGHDNG